MEIHPHLLASSSLLGQNGGPGISGFVEREGRALSQGRRDRKGVGGVKFCWSFGLPGAACRMWNQERGAWSPFVDQEDDSSTFSVRLYETNDADGENLNNWVFTSLIERRGPSYESLDGHERFCKWEVVKSVFMLFWFLMCVLMRLGPCIQGSTRMTEETALLLTPNALREVVWMISPSPVFSLCIPPMPENVKWIFLVVLLETPCPMLAENRSNRWRCCDS